MNRCKVWMMLVTSLFVVSASAGVKDGGLVVHVGCGDGKETAQLQKHDRLLVHGLDTDLKNVAAARKYIRGLGLYGGVSVDVFDGKHLPYSDNLVNRMVASGTCQVAKEEILRVLVPNGVAMVGDKKIVKPWPDDIDEWTHYLHDESNNAVARDKRVGPPKQLKWVCGPLWARSHEFNSSLCAMVTAGGRIFYIIDEGLTSITDDPIPERWTLVARDAFNGKQLWKKPLENWGAKLWKRKALRGVPSSIMRRIVARGDRVYVTLGYLDPVSILDAATGEVIQSVAGTERTSEILLHQDVLLARLGGDKQLKAVNTRSGEIKWAVEAHIPATVMAASDGRVFCQDGPNVSCRYLKDGKVLWTFPCQPAASKLVAHQGRLLVASKKNLVALDINSGKPVWKTGKGTNSRDLMVANGKVWAWQGHNVGALDFKTGQPVETLDADDVFTPGHHLRCYPSKATEQFIITPNRGVEFVSLTGGDNTQCDWTRGACTYGIMPGNGLLYVPPNPCFCYPGVKITGFNALASGETKGSVKGARLEKGPAYGHLEPGTWSLEQAWPSYRHDARRTGGTKSKTPADFWEQWRIHIPGRLTQPVVAGETICVAAKDRHTVYALHAKKGRELWTYTAGGRIDSPPTLYKGLVLFGCADGWVYSLRAADGVLAWRFRAAPADRRIIAFDQLESPWRVHGSILVKDGVAYCTAGRSTYLDGGIHVFGLDPETGKVLHQTVVDSSMRTREDAVNQPFIPGYHMEGAFSDILVSEGPFIYLGQYKFDRSLKVQKTAYTLPDPKNPSPAMGMNDLTNKTFVSGMKSMKKEEKVQRDWQRRVWPKLFREFNEKFGGSNLGEKKLGRRVFSTGGFLDDSWFNRTYWMYADVWPGFYIGHRGAKTGQLLAVGPRKTYGVQAFPNRNVQSPLFTPGKDGYLLFADNNDNEPVLPDYTKGVPKGIGFTRTEPPAWFKWVPIRIRAMVVADDVLFVAGPPDELDPENPMASFEGKKGAVLRAFSTADGSQLAEGKINAAPVFDGLIAAGGRLFMTTIEGDLICMGR